MFSGLLHILFQKISKMIQKIDDRNCAHVFWDNAYFRTKWYHIISTHHDLSKEPLKKGHFRTGMWIFGIKEQSCRDSSSVNLQLLHLTDQLKPT